LVEIAPAVVGLIVGVVVGLTSTGGGALLTPALVLVLGVPASAAIGSDVLIASVMKFFGGGFYALRREVHWPTVLRLAVGSIPGAGVGVALLNRLAVDEIDTILQRSLGAVLVVAGAATLARLLVKGRSDRVSMPRWPATVALGFGTGVLVATTSVGSGSLLLCVLTCFFPLGPATMVGTDLVHALFLSTAATVGHLAAGRVNVPLAASVLVGAVPGVILGARFASGMPERALRAVLAVLLIGIGVSLALLGAGPTHPAAALAVVGAGR